MLAVALIGSIHGRTKTGRFPVAAVMDPRSAPKADEHRRRLTPDAAEPDLHYQPQSRKPNKTGVHYRFLLRAGFG